MEQASDQSPETNKELSYQEKIAQYDKAYGIAEFDIEDTLQNYLMMRNNGTVEAGWVLIGQGPEKGKLVKLSEVMTGEPSVKYADVAQLEADQASLLVEFQRQRSAQTQEIGHTAVEQVVQPAAFIEQAQPSAERNTEDPYDYIREVLPPVVRPSDSKTSNDNFMDNQRYYTPESSEDKLRKYYDKFVTEENRQRSVEVLAESLKTNAEVKDILAQSGLNPVSIEAVDAIRENADVRFEVAKYFAKKLDHLVTEDPESVGWRIEANSPSNIKVDPQTGKRMLSRVYAVNLALKMLGGEFSERHETNDFARDANDRVAVGQHRDAASTILMSS